MTIRTGIGGWVYEPWRDGVLYPKGLKQADELHYASRAVRAIEINATFYSRQKPESFAKWHNPPPFRGGLDGGIHAIVDARPVGLAPPPPSPSPAGKGRLLPFSYTPSLR